MINKKNSSLADMIMMFREGKLSSLTLMKALIKNNSHRVAFQHLLMIKVKSTESVNRPIHLQKEKLIISEMSLDR
jgi:hypothetical protein